MKTMTTERERQRTQVPGYEWIVVSPWPWVPPVRCRASSESGAFRVAEAEHPGVHWTFAVRRECHCHGRIDCRCAHELCAACERPKQRLDMVTLSVPGIGMAGPHVCRPCHHVSAARGLGLAELRTQIAQMRWLDHIDDMVR
jgi:hypothetical protein